MALLTHDDKENVTKMVELTPDEIDVLVKAHEEREKEVETQPASTTTTTQ